MAQEDRSNAGYAHLERADDPNPADDASATKLLFIVGEARGKALAVDSVRSSFYPARTRSCFRASGYYFTAARFLSLSNRTRLPVLTLARRVPLAQSVRMYRPGRESAINNETPATLAADRVDWPSCDPAQARHSINLGLATCFADGWPWLGWQNRAANRSLSKRDWPEPNAQALF